MRAVGGAAFFLLVISVQACGSEDEATTPIEQIPADKKIVDLDAPERRGLCAYNQQVAQSKLPAAGTQLKCGGITLTWNGMSCSASTPPDCPATIAEWKVCLPNFIDRLAEDPCQILDLQFPGALEEFVDTTPGCEGLGPCSYTL